MYGTGIFCTQKIPKTFGWFKRPDTWSIPTLLRSIHHVLKHQLIIRLHIKCSQDDSRIALQGLSREVHDELGSKWPWYAVVRKEHPMATQLPHCFDSYSTMFFFFFGFSAFFWGAFEIGIYWTRGKEGKKEWLTFIWYQAVLVMISFFCRCWNTLHLNKWIYSTVMYSIHVYIHIHNTIHNILYLCHYIYLICILSY